MFHAEEIVFSKCTGARYCILENIPFSCLIM